MNSLKLKLLIVACSFTIAVSTQTLQQYYIGVGNSSNALSGSSLFQYDNGLLTMGSTLDNKLSFQNSFGTGVMQFTNTGQFTWKTPLNGTGKLALTNTGQLKIGTDLVNGDSYGDQFSLQIKNGGAIVYRTLANSAMGAYNHSSYNVMHLNGNISTMAENAAQVNYLRASSGTMSGYQSAAQKNFLDFNNVSYSEMFGQIWSVQANTFQLSYGSSTSSKIINTYLQTVLTPGSNLGNYYTLYLESPTGNGNVSQLGNYWGMYQQSPNAKNYFAGNMLIGTTTDAGYKLDVNGAVRVGSVTSDPTGANGALFYNSATNQFKGYRNGEWKNILMEGDASSGSSNWSVTGSTIYNSNSGNVGIGTTDTKGYKFAVNGDAIFTKLKVKQYGSWPDYVFDPAYKLPSLKEVEEFITKHKHLPEVPSAKEVEQNGLDVGDNHATLLKKIEELTLYIIEQDKKIEKLETQNTELSDIKKELELIKVKIQN